MIRSACPEPERLQGVRGFLLRPAVGSGCCVPPTPRPEALGTSAPSALPQPGPTDVLCPDFSAHQSWEWVQVGGRQPLLPEYPLAAGPGWPPPLRGARLPWGGSLRGDMWASSGRTGFVDQTGVCELPGRCAVHSMRMRMRMRDAELPGRVSVQDRVGDE